MTLPVGLQAPARPTPLARLKDAAACGLRYAPTEARRNRVLYAAWPAIILGTVPFTAAVATATGIPVGQAVSGAVAAWVGLGLPLTAVIFGAVAGAGLRGPAEEMEGPLPLPPRARAFGALGAASAAFLASALLVTVLAGAIHWDVRALVSGVTRRDLDPLYGYFAWASSVAVLSSAWLLTTSFAAAYASSHAVLGAIAALAGGGLLLLPAVAGCALHLNHAAGREGPFLAATAAATAVSAGAAALALAWSAPAAPRRARVRWMTAALMCLLPLSGAMGSWAAFWISGRAIQTRLWPTDNRSVQAGTEPVSDGLYAGIGGRFVFKSPSGTLILLPGSSPTLGELARYGEDGIDRVNEAFVDRDGRVWVEVLSASREGQPSVPTIWTGPRTGPLIRYASFLPDYHLGMKDQRAAAYAPWATVSDEADRWKFLDPASPPHLKGDSEGPRG